MTKKSINKISDKLTKVSESVTVYIYDNGYMLEANGRNSDDDWDTAKIMCNSLEGITALLKEASEMERD
jgi:hypothetical protein